MLNVALVGLMAGSLLTAPVTDDDDKKKKTAPDADEARIEAEAPAGIFTRSEVEAPASRAITQDTYSFGVPSDAAPIKLWASYAYGETEGRYDAAGNTAEYESPALPGTGGQQLYTSGDIIAQRVAVGGQLNLINFPAFKLGGGATLTIAKNELQFGGDNMGVLDATELSTDFELQNVKVFGTARGRVLGVHGGYIFDIASEADPIDGTVTILGPGGTTAFQGNFTDLQAAGGVAPEDYARFSVTDDRDAVFFGADFDAAGDVFRAFGGVDYFYVLDSATSDDGTQDDFIEDDAIINFILGAGVKLSIFEIGAAAQITTRLREPLISSSVGTVPGVGGHRGTIAPYLNISPGSLPASIFVRGGVLSEYTESGYAIGGANAAKSSFGFTAGLAVGFD